jgi:hypothetical protein
MQFTFLAEPLQPLALAAAKHFRINHGAKAIRAEQAVDAAIPFRPTLVGRTQDHYTLCVEVSDSGFSTALEEFVQKCGQRCLPVKAYIAAPPDVDDSVFRAMATRAASLGVGVLEVDPEISTVTRPAMPMTLYGFRRPIPRKFPTKYRQALVDAETLVVGGDPAKGCSRVYEEIENLSRAVAKEVDTRGWWRPLHAGEVRPAPDFEIGNWQEVMALLENHAQFKAIKPIAPAINRAMIAKVHGLAPDRNLTAHKPKSRTDLITRDQRLRTKFEFAVDTLHELILASKPLKV